MKKNGEIWREKGDKVSLVEPGRFGRESGSGILRL